MFELKMAAPFERLVARVIDKVVITVPVYLWFADRSDPKILETIGGGLLLISIVLLNYLWNGETLGKRIMKIRIGSPTGGRLNIVNYLVRELAFTLYPIYLVTQPFVRGAWFVWMMATIMLIMLYGRGLHDIIAGTVVVKNLPIQISEKTVA